MDDREGSILDIAYFRPVEPEIRRERVAFAAVSEPAAVEEAIA
jgi:hypothetical protein